MSERTATDQLMDTVRELVYDGAQESVVAILEQQIAINTQTELENRALREFVAVCDHDEQLDLCLGESAHYQKARQCLAAEHGLPLPGAGEPS